MGVRAKAYDTSSGEKCADVIREVARIRWPIEMNASAPLGAKLRNRSCLSERQQFKISLTAESPIAWPLILSGLFWSTGKMTGNKGKPIGGCVVQATDKQHRRRSEESWPINSNDSVVKQSSSTSTVRFG
jgi:hypothetical protein